PGLGRYTVDAVYARDYPAIQGSVLFIAFIFVVVNLITDVLYAYINPRIRYR
ncbi:MAG: ABC transporter permease subunit, partial [Candidatus Atribacteria bacterium]|nr:ABC transporter permease subunit [Candidatus Atribacteria bacterium]